MSHIDPASSQRRGHLSSRSLPYLAAALFTLVASFAVTSPAAAQRAGCVGMAPEGSEIRIAGDDEPGERLVITGRAVDADGNALAGVVARIYHTDAEGYYSRGGMDESKSRLCGVLETAADGSYRIETIRPGEYATGGPNPHVHFDAELPDGGDGFFTLFWTGVDDSGDPASGDRTASRRPMVRTDHGTLRMVFDLEFSGR